MRGGLAGVTEGVVGLVLRGGGPEGIWWESGELEQAEVEGEWGGVEGRELGESERCRGGKGRSSEAAEVSMWCLVVVRGAAGAGSEVAPKDGGRSGRLEGLGAEAERWGGVGGEGLTDMTGNGCKLGSYESEW